VRIQILGEGGGIGDVLRRLGIIRSIKAAIPDAVVWFVAPGALIEWAKLDPIPDQLVAAPNNHRGVGGLGVPDTYKYIAVGYPFDVTLDLYDPAELAENQAPGPIQYNRAEVWLHIAAATFNKHLMFRQCKVHTTPVDAEQAATMLRTIFGKLRLVIGLQPLSHWRWRSLCFEQVYDIVKRLNQLGAQCVLFHHTEQPVKQWAEQLGTIAIVNEKPTVVAELIRLCDGIITCDSGLFHVAGTLNVPTVGLFAQTDGALISRGYTSCRAITAGPTERKGLACRIPCYRRASHGCYNPVCERSCQALHRVSGKAAADLLLRLIVELQGKHLPPTTLKGRLFYNKYRSVSTP